jgi:ferritin-like metal-binding protein YciE
MLLDNLSDLFQRGLEYAWDTEHVLIRYLPRVAQAASSQDLSQILDFHLVETKGHIYRLEQIFARLGRSPAAEKHEPVRVIVSECERMMARLDRSPLRDAALIFCAHQIEQSEIGLYEPLVGFALTLGFDNIAGALAEMLGQERETAHQLMRLAGTSINRAASHVENARPFAMI